MAVVSPDNTSLWEPPVHRGMNSADPLQRHVDSSFMTESSHPLNERYPRERETLSGDSQDDPISIMSDDDTVESASDTDEDDGDDSDSTLPSVRSLVASLPKAPPNNPSRQQHGTSANAETDDPARHPEHPDPVQRSSPSSDAHTVVEHLPPLPPPASLVSSLGEAPGPEQASYVSDDATPAQDQIHEAHASINPEQGPVLSEADYTVGVADAEPPHPAGIKRKRLLELSQGIRRSVPRDDNSEAESGFDSESSKGDREGRVLSSQHRLAQGPHKRRKGGQHVADSVPIDLITGSNAADVQSTPPPTGRGKGSQHSTRTTPIPRRNSSPVHSIEASRDPSVPPSRLENSLAGGAATYQEWPVRAWFQRVMLGNGRATFQLRFDWDPEIDCEHPKRPENNGHDASVSRDGGQRDEDPDGDGGQSARPRSNGSRTPVPGDSGQRNKVTRSRGFTSEENRFLTELKGQKNLRWSEITTEFNNNFPERERSQGYLQVHYSTKLKKRKKRNAH
ncbi:hypothetical protein VDGL01_08334 [Verticillium dahliae]